VVQISSFSLYTSAIIVRVSAAAVAGFAAFLQIPFKLSKAARSLKLNANIDFNSINRIDIVCKVGL
jgi:hypothetical protein